MDTVIGSEGGQAMTCCNCGLDNHDWRACHRESMDEILRQCGYSYNRSVLVGCVCVFRVFLCTLFLWLGGLYRKPPMYDFS